MNPNDHPSTPISSFSSVSNGVQVIILLSWQIQCGRGQSDEDKPNVQLVSYFKCVQPMNICSQGIYLARRPQMLA